MPLGCHAHTLAVACAPNGGNKLLICCIDATYIYSASASYLHIRRAQRAFYFNFAHPVALHTFRRIYLSRFFFFLAAALQRCTQILACGQHLSVINAAGNLIGVQLCVCVCGRLLATASSISCLLNNSHVCVVYF